MIATWMIGIGLAALALGVALVLSLRSYNRFAAAARGPASFALPRGNQTSALDAALDPVLAAHPGQQGLFNVLEGRDAFATRTLATRSAGRSLDIISYIWRTDLTGWLMLAELIAAADRGVRVRVLLDDVNVQGLDPVFLGLSRHPGIEVRLFNPIRNRGHAVRRATEFVIGLSRFNRRIHSKAWIADSRLAIVGGRNVGDIYFGAVQDGFEIGEDADVVLVGSKVDEVQSVFDTYWNLGLSLPIVTLWPGLQRPARSFRARLDRHVNSPASLAYLAETLPPGGSPQMLTERLRWTDQVEILSDPPEKAFGKRSGPWLSNRIEALIEQTGSDLRLITPYFVPGKPGMDLLARLRQRGVTVSLLTNSLASTDLMAIHGAYTYYRRRLLALGVRLYELGPRPGRWRRLAFLHSKVFLFYDRKALIGSANFDLRSANLNIELGLVFEQPELLAELVERFQLLTGPESAYAVSERDGRLIWQQNGPDQPVILTVEPEASMMRMMIAGVMRILPHGYF